MKLSIRNSLLILLAGLFVVSTGSFLSVQEKTTYNALLMLGLLLNFVGSLMLVISIYHKRKS